MTLVNTFSMMERHRPAMMSPGSLPFLCSVMMLLFMNTVQRLPSTAGFSESKASSAIFSTGMWREAAKFSRKEPQPEEQASLTRMLVMMPLSSQMAFMSWPPMSRIKLASFTYFSTARAWATVSTTWYSVLKALLNRSSP